MSAIATFHWSIFIQFRFMIKTKKGNFYQQVLLEKDESNLLKFPYKHWKHFDRKFTFSCGPVTQTQFPIPLKELHSLEASRQIASNKQPFIHQKPQTSLDWKALKRLSRLSSFIITTEGVNEREKSPAYLSNFTLIIVFSTLMVTTATEKPKPRKSNEQIIVGFHRFILLFSTHNNEWKSLETKWVDGNVQCNIKFCF